MAVRCCLMCFTGMFALLGLCLLVAGSVINVGFVSLDCFVDSSAAAPAVMIIVIGGCMFFTAVVGYCGASIYKACKLYLFAGMLIGILLLKVIIGIVAILYAKDATSVHDKKLDDAVKTYNVSSSSSECMDKIQRLLECCGSNDYNDYSGNKLPGSCCVKKESECIKSGKEHDHFIIGCKEKMHRYNFLANASLGGVLLGLIVVEIIGVILAVVMATLAAHGPPVEDI